MNSSQAKERAGARPVPPGEAAVAAIEAAIWAPSVHNTQPWWFGTRAPRDGDTVISLHADVERRLDVADPDGREMLISCGAALCTLRLAVLALGYVPEVVLLPDPDRPGLLADVHVGGPIEVGEELRRLHAEIRRRRSHRGPFRDSAVGAPVLCALRDEAEREGAHLQIATELHVRGALAALTEAAEHVQRLDPSYVSEMARWSPAPGSRRLDGVHETAYPSVSERTEPNFPMRDFSRGHGWGSPEPGSAGSSVGVVAMLTTRGDTRADWLTAGQALQRILLRGSAANLSAAFHTQALEVPELRDFIRARFCGGAHPQMIMRMGVADGGFETVRRPADHVVSEER